MNQLFPYIPTKTDYPEIITLWEKSVVATHHFLTKRDIKAYKNLILNQFLDQVDLYCYRNEFKILGFIGLNQDMIQMLFIHPDARNKGIGKQLLLFAIEQKRCTKVHVNEQNEQAKGFYKHFGFQIMERFDHDSAGKPYPILAMELNPASYINA
ncbi:GNAT family N-acetyltransferase [Pedobacter mucosus]|uniref:GNAT family N-acetyltransferase n=1 Tax=Pedobacter mucosus TaxID=2895286 RepID=UPI001EE40473|nr:GNAT family N-acetyltransferase [Pedobacter mucosus]UKT63948.1 GNAT family N-acetyltransferase [Pedobacter mucosus]